MSELSIQECRTQSDQTVFRDVINQHHMAVFELRCKFILHLFKLLSIICSESRTFCK